MARRLPGHGTTLRQRLLSLPGVRLLASKRFTPHWEDNQRTWRRLDLIEVRARPRRYLVVENLGRHFAEVSEYFTLIEARVTFRRNKQAADLSEDVAVLVGEG